VKGKPVHLGEVVLEKIDQKSPGWDDFIFTYKPELERITSKLKRLGEIYPSIVEKRGDDKYRIVAGFAQIRAAEEAGGQTIEAKIFEQGEIPPPELFLLALMARPFEGSISPVEKAVALKKAIELFGFEEEEIEQEMAPLLDIPASREVIGNYLMLAEAAEVIKDAVHFGKLPANQAFLLFPFKKADRLALFNLLQDLQPSFNEAKEILRNIGDVARMQKRPIKEILGLKEIEGILQPVKRSVRAADGQDKTLSRRKKKELLRWALRKLRYPFLSGTEEEMRKCIKALALSPEVHLSFDPTFETEEITLTLEAKDEEKIACALKTLQAALEAGKFAHLFSLLKGPGLPEGERDEV
jgi:ParB-like chromosome segregation protein Spo0J